MNKNCFNLNLEVYEGGYDVGWDDIVGGICWSPSYNIQDNIIGGNITTDDEFDKYYFGVMSTN